MKPSIGADETTRSHRSVLVLQGPLSDYYSLIGEELLALGVHVHRINFCGSDAHNWTLPGARNYTGAPENWEAFLSRFVAEHNVTDILLHGDRRFYHKNAIQVATKHGINVIATELGYLRPDWMTLEKGGCSTLSHFPSCPDKIMEIAAEVGPRSRDLLFPSIWSEQVIQELSFSFRNALNKRVFPHYQNHRQESRIEVYSGWLKAQLLKKRRSQLGAKAFQNMLNEQKPYFVAALQLNGDFQIREHSPFISSVEVLEHIIASFAYEAPANALLAIKPHPLEYRDRVLKKALKVLGKKYKVSKRLRWLHGVSIGTLTRKAAGFVTLNSSAGFEALEQGCPTCTIMPTLYDVDGLTYQGHLDGFWQDATPPDLQLFNALTDAIAGSIQVRGTIYSAQGRRAAARSSAFRIAHQLVNKPNAFEALPPRLKKAAEQGVELLHWQPPQSNLAQSEIA